MNTIKGQSFTSHNFRSSVFILLVLLASVACGQEAPLSLSLKLDKTTVKLGQAIDITFILKNRSASPLVVANPATSPRPTVGSEDWGVILKVVGPDGRTTRFERTDELAAMQLLKRESFSTLEPGKTLTGKARLGDLHDPLINDYERWVIYRPGRTVITEKEMNALSGAFSRPGRYLVSATYNNSVDQYWKNTTLQRLDAWLGSVTSPAVVLEIKP